MKRREFLKSTVATASESLSSEALVRTPEIPQTASPLSTIATQRSRNLIRTTAGVEPYTGQWNKKVVAHLLRRTIFGPTRNEIASVASRSLDDTLATLFLDQPQPSPPIDPTTGQTWVNSAYDGNNDGRYIGYLKAWWLGLMVTQGISLRERMVLFWHNHFVSEYVDVQDSRYMYFQNVLFRQYVLGNIKELVKAVTIDPAMLRYLNGNTNVKGRGQENYARELQELFTIGKGPQTGPDDYTNYTEQDVQMAARVLTGWRDVRSAAPPRSEFVASNHDTSDKTFSSAYQNTVIRGGGTAADGPRELNELVEMIFRQPETAKFLCRKLYRWFVYYDIDQTIEENVIVPLAEIMRGNNYEVRPVLEALLQSAHFFDDNNIGCFIKSPIDLVAGAVHQLGISIPPPTSAAYYSLFGTLTTSSSSTNPSTRMLQMDLLDPPDVAGWKAYYQVPDFYELWISTATLPARGGFTDALVNGYRAGATYRINPITYASTMSDPANPFKLIDDLGEDLFALTLTPKQKDYLLYNVLGLVHNDEYEWSARWNEYIADPNNAQKREFIQTRLNTLLKFMMRMAEFQLA